MLKHKKMPLIIAAAYFLLGILWLVLSEIISGTLFKDIVKLQIDNPLSRLSIIAATTVFLFFLASNLIKTDHQMEGSAEDLAERRQVAEGLRDILALLNSNSSLEIVLDNIVEQASVLLNAGAVAIYRLHHQDGVLKIESSRGLSAAYISAADIPLGMSATGRAALMHEPVSISDVTTASSSVNISFDEQGIELLTHLADQQYRAVLAVPLVGRSEDVYGTITLYYRNPHIFSDNEIGLAASFADQVALAIDNSQLRTQVEQTAIIAERNRLARELHDSITQSIYSMGLYTDAARLALLAGKQEVVDEYLHELRSLSRDAMLEMRLQIFELHPPILEQEGLVASIKARLESVETRAGVKSEIHVDGERRLPNHIELELYRITQEALTNVVKHSKAKHVKVQMLFQENNFHLEIWDNGVGFELETARLSGGQGLRGIEERLQQIGGQLSVSSIPGQGATLCVDVEI